MRSARLAPTVPAGSTALGPVAAAQPVAVDVVLAPSDPSGLAALVSAVQDPASPSYHHWLTPAQFAARFAPSPAEVRSVTSWLAARGLAAHRTSVFALAARADAVTVGRGLGVTLERYRTGAGAQGFVAGGAPLVPSGLQGTISSILGLDTLPAFRPDHTRAAPPHRVRAAVLPAGTASTALALPTACPQATSDANSYGGWTFSGLGRAYGVDSLLTAGLNGSGQTIAFYELSPHSASDVSTYDTCFGLTNPLATVTVDSGGTVDPNGTAEADLDIEQASTQAPGAALLSYEGPNSGTGPYDVWNRIVNEDRARVISTSWDVCEPDAYSWGEFSSFGPLFAQAVTQGQTILAASGDSGSEGCFQGNGSTTLETSYPSTDPNVTAVGGTDLTGTGPETVWNDCAGTGSSICASNNGGQDGGGGGLSRYEPLATGQPVVATWPSAQPCKSSCREVPDISANAGIAMAEYDTGGWWAGLGTSFSAPFLAGVVADRNTGCAGGSTGNLNRVLYGVRSAGSSAAAFNDVTSGNNDMTQTNGGAYAAGPGFDLASGLGSPVATGLTCPEVESVAPTTATAGTQVTVTGFGLEGAKVTFSGVAATVVSSSATSATVVVPAGTGTASVAAHSVLGTGTASAAFTWAATSGGSTTTTTTTTTTTVPKTTTTTTPTTTAPTTTAPTTTTAPAPAPVACPAGAGPVLGSGAGIAAVDVGGCKGYLVADRAGQVSAFGAATWHGDLSGYSLSAPVIAIQATSDGQGYWLLGADGGVFTFGDARFFGSTGGIRLAAPVVGMAVTPDSRGYWVVARDGGVFSFGDARFFGSTGGLHLASPVDGIAVAPGGSGYWLVAGDGGVFTFTRDGFYGSLGGVHLARPIVGMSSTPDGRGYTLVGSDGGVFTFGDAPFYGSLGSSPPASAIVDLSPAPADNGYYLVSVAGTVYTFGPGTRYFGSA